MSAPPKRKRVSTKLSEAKEAKSARTPRRVDSRPVVTSPAAAGPSGALLEAHVGAQYLLPLLSGGEARGLPGVLVTRVAFQRAGFNHPMDDVVVTGHDGQGRPAVLELQAKRTISFTASDNVFADVVSLACRAASKPEFSTTRYELAVAIARTSSKIEQHIQDVLKWAREYQAADEFFKRLNQPGAAHQAMRDFVSAFRGHMCKAGASNDDEFLWRLLSRFQILPFDFERQGSVCAQLARERCALLLSPRNVSRSGELWDTLQQIALGVDAVGGDLDVTRLRTQLTSEHDYHLAGDRRLYLARERLAEMADNALAMIDTQVHGVRIDRSDRVEAAHSALQIGRYLEIRGAGGVGKSGVLKDLALRVGIQSRVVVIAPHRIPAGGWTALATQLGCHASAREFLADLAGDGGGTLFIDGLDRFDDPGQRVTVVDLIRAAADVVGFCVIATARLDFDSGARGWLPAQVLQRLGEAPPLIIDELGKDEVAQLRNANTALASLLRPEHPAEKLVRNLYRLGRLARGMEAGATAAFSEAQMAWQWWKTGDAPEPAGRLDRCRLLRTLAEHSLSTSTPMETRTSPAEAISALISSGSLRAISSIRVEPTHDVLRDWSIGCLLYEDPEHFAALALETPAPVRLVRGLEIAARLHAEIGIDETGWRALLDRASVPGAHGSWRRAVLLALVRSECANETLNRCLPALAAGDAELLADLVRAAIAVDSQSAAPIWKALGTDTSNFTDDFVIPRGPTWSNLIFWSIGVEKQLPHKSIPQFVDLYFRWCCACAGADSLSPVLISRLYAWLMEVQKKNHPKELYSRERMDVGEVAGLSMNTSQENDLRTAFLMWCRLQPNEAESYLQWVLSHPHRRALMSPLLRFVGTAATAAPRALADLFLQVLPEGDNEEDIERAPTWGTFSGWDSEYFPPSPARAPFLDLLQADKEQGLRLVHAVVEHDIRQRTRGQGLEDGGIVVPLHGERRLFPLRQTYLYSRAQGSSVVASALMALEAWGHQRIERGEPVQSVIDDVLGPDGSAAAYLLVAIDVMLSHWPITRECLWPFASSAELLAIDRSRYAYDLMNIGSTFSTCVRSEPAGSAQLESLMRRLSRRRALDVVLSDFGWNGPDVVRVTMRQALQEEVARIGAPDSGSANWMDPRFAAMSALNLLNVENYVSRPADEDGQITVEYIVPENEVKLQIESQKNVMHGDAEFAIRTQLADALTKASCSEQLLEKGVFWATTDTSASQAESDWDGTEWTERTRFIVAALVIRDGTRELKAAHGIWARSLLAEAAGREPDDHVVIKQLPYNPAAIAAVGFLAACRDGSDFTDQSRLLQLAARPDAAMASVLHADVIAQRPVRPELARSLIRLGLKSAIYAVRQCDENSSGNNDDYIARQQALETARQEAEQARLQNAVIAELNWLAGDSAEPSWPELPDAPPPKSRNRFSFDGAKSKQNASREPQRLFALNAAAAAQWLPLAAKIWRDDRPDLLRDLVRHFWSWTASANGVGCKSDEEPGELAIEWNNAYFTAALAAAVRHGNTGIHEYVFDLLDQLPEERFFDAAEAVLHALDQLWLNDSIVSDSTAISIRDGLAQRLVATRSWSRLMSERSAGIEFHLAGVVAAIFMGQQVLRQGPHCYIRPLGADSAELSLPMLTQLVEQAAGSTFVAIAFFELLEVKPNTNQLPFMARAVAAWWRVQGANAEFWSDYGVGRRLCEWVDKAILGPTVSMEVINSAELIAIVDTLLLCGTPLARALEERVTACRQAGEK